jgi:hypothetical protein
MKVIAYLSRCNIYFTPDMFTCQELSSYGKNDSNLVITGPVIAMSTGIAWLVLRS